LAQCTTGAAVWTDLNGAGGAPCFDGTTCAITDPDFTTAGIGVWGGDSYSLDNVQAGAQYTFSMCAGVGAGAWIPSITIVAPGGVVDAYSAGTAGNFPASCSLNWTASASGTYQIIIHRQGDACGAALQVDNGNPTVSCGASPALCNPVVCSAGVLDDSQSPITLCPGETFDMVTDGSESSAGAFAIFLSPQAGASGGLGGALFLSPIQSFPLTGINNDLGGVLSSNSLPPLVGTWAFYTVAYSNLADAQGSVCSISADSIMVTFLTANDAQCIPCTADAGTLNAVATPVCLTNGSATIAATVGTAPVVPSGYSVGYALTDANGVVQQIGLTPSFTVNAAGNYTIHTIVYNQSTLNPLLFTPGVTTAAQVNALLIQGGGSICGSLDMTGAPVQVTVCVTCTANAGTLTAVASPVCVTNGSGTIAATVATPPVVPNGYSVGYAVTDANGVVQQIGLTPSFTVTAAGDYTIHTLVYDPQTLNPLLFTPGVTTAADVNALLIQGGGTICGSLDLVGAPVEAVICLPCTADAGTITADATPVCLNGGSVTISATADGNSVVPSGYQTSYVLTQGAGLVILDVAATPSFTVTSGGNYTIHTLVFDPITGAPLLNATTGSAVNALLQQGGGVICGSLDVAGAPIVVEAPNAGTLTVANPQTCVTNGSGTIVATPTGNAVVPTGYQVLYGLADASGTIQQIGSTSTFAITATGNYTVHTLVYDPATLNTSLFVPGFVTITMVNGAIGTVCASFDATGVAITAIACAQCTADAGTLTATSTPVCFENGSVVISATANGDAVVPAGYSTGYAVTDVNGVVTQIGLTPSFTITAIGDYTIHAIVFDPQTLNPLLFTPGVTTAAQVNALLIQGGGVICGSLDLAGAPISVIDCTVPCTANAGTLTATQATVCLANGSATIAASANGNAVVPSGYSVGYAVTNANGVVTQVGLSPSFTVTAAGVYTIHTIVFDPLTLNPLLFTPGVTTAAQVNALLIQGGGTICGSLDLVGATVTVQVCNVTCNVSDGTLITSSNLICLFDGSAVLAATHTVLPSFPIGFEVLYVLTEGPGLTIVATNNFPVFTVTTGGSYTIHTLVYDPLTLDPTTATTGIQVNALLEQGGGSICGALDVAGVAITVPNIPSVVGILDNVGDSLYLTNASGTSGYQWFFNGNPIPGAVASSYVIEESGNYAVQYTGENGCIQSSATLPFTFSGGNIGFEEYNLFTSVVVFPNPSNGMFSIRGEMQRRSDLTINITDITGRNVVSTVSIQDVDMFTQPMDISTLSNGFYFVRIQASEGDVTVRFVKQ